MPLAFDLKIESGLELELYCSLTLLALAKKMCLFVAHKKNLVEHFCASKSKSSTAARNQNRKKNGTRYDAVLMFTILRRTAGVSAAR